MKECVESMAFSWDKAKRFLQIMVAFEDIFETGL
jgi:hypothetical protein